MSAKTEIIEWSGGKLTNAAYLGYAEDVLKVYAAKGFDNLGLAVYGPQLQAAINRLADFVKRKRSFSQTATIAKNDATRDALFKAFYHAWSYTLQTDDSCPLHAHALALKPVMDAYKGIWSHELVRETKEINGLQRDLETSASVNALKELGLYKIVGALFEANTAVDTAYDTRTAERGQRDADKEDDTAPSLRKAVGTILTQCAKCVNAVNLVNPSETTAATIVAVNGVIHQYKLVAAQPAHNASGGDTPDPEPEPAPDGVDAPSAS